MTHIPAAALDLQLVAAGVGLHLAVTRVGSWVRRRHEAWPAWFGMSAAGMALVLVCNVAVLRRPTEIDLFIRTLALSAVLVCLLASVASFTGQRLPRLAQPALLALVVGRIVLWLSSDLVFAHRVVDGLPQYGPLVGWTAVPALLLLLGQTTVVAARVAQPFERLALLAGTGVGLVTATATLAVGDARIAELLTGCWTIPQLVVMQIVLVHRRTAEIDRQGRFHRGQVAMARLGELAVEEQAVDRLVLHVTEAVEVVLSRSCDVVLVPDHEDPVRRDTGGWTQPINGRQGTIGRIEVGGDGGDDTDRQFLEMVAHFLGAWVERAAADHDAKWRSLHDELTGLPNRALLRARLDVALRRAEAFDAGMAVVFLDLDGFKDLNDALGHAAGDEVLTEVAGRLASAATASASVCRFGGDEFVVVCDTPTDEVSALALGRTLQAALSEPIACAGTTVALTACAGVVVSRAGDTPEAVLRDADTAMYHAKEQGAGRIATFDPLLRRQLLTRIETQQALGRAAGLGEIEVHYQPVVDLRTLEPISVEALARWRRNGELIPPLEWIGMAETTGAIVDIGRDVLRQACRDALRLPRHMGVAVNVSPRQLSPGFAAVVDEALSVGLEPGRLTLEITESALIEDAVMVGDLLANLRRRGVRTAIDDFGTGFSSLSQVASLPIDVLKIDRSFVDRLTSIDGHAIVATIVALADALDLDVVAEGVEHGEQVDLLRQMGCAAAQGFLFARPGPLDDHKGVARYALS